MRATIAIAAMAVAAMAWRAATPEPPPASATAATHTAGAAPAVPRQPPAPLLPAAAPAPRQSAGLPGASASADKVPGVEASVRDARRRGKDEQEIHRLRSALLPASQVEAIARMESAEARWRQRLEALRAACAANIGCEHARASFTREELARAAAYAPPTLRQ